MNRVPPLKSVETAENANASGEEQSPPKVAELSPVIDLDDPALYLNRELTWLEFNRRVLAEAEDQTNPLLERLKFTAIFASNIDEFFMKRMGGLKIQVAANVTELTVDGRTPLQQLMECKQRVKEITAKRNRVFDELLAELENHDIRSLKYDSLDDDQKEELRQHYMENVFR